MNFLSEAAEDRHEKILTTLREKTTQWKQSRRAANVFTLACRTGHPATTRTLASAVSDETVITLLDKWNAKCSIPRSGIVEVQRDLGADAVGVTYEDGDLVVIYVVDQLGDEYLVTCRGDDDPVAAVGTNLLVDAGLPAAELTHRVAELTWRIAGPLPYADASIRAMWPQPGMISLDDDGLNERYLIPEGTGRHLRLLMVASLDGVAAVDGVSAPLGSPGDKRMYDVIRAQADLLLVGAATVRAEQYGITALSPLVIAQRIARGQQPYPTVAVVSRSLRIDPAGPLFQPVPGYHTPPRPILIAPTAAVATCDPDLAARAEILPVGDADVDLAAALAVLSERGHRSIVCEGGPDLAAQLTREGLVDELCLTVAPLMLATGGPRITSGGGEPVQARWQIQESYIDEQGDLFLRYLPRRVGVI